MAQNLCYNFCILETNPYVLKNYIQYIGDVLHLCFKDHMFIIHRKKYLIFLSWLLLLGGSSNFHGGSWWWAKSGVSTGEVFEQQRYPVIFLFEYMSIWAVPPLLLRIKTPFY